jgi:hypothetical protein
MTPLPRALRRCTAGHDLALRRALSLSAFPRGEQLERAGPLRLARLAVRVQALGNRAWVSKLMPPAVAKPSSNCRLRIASFTLRFLFSVVRDLMRLSRASPLGPQGSAMRQLAHRHVVRKTDTIRNASVELYPSCVRAKGRVR